jgi:hypothetical protein
VESHEEDQRAYFLGFMFSGKLIGVRYEKFFLREELLSYHNSDISYHMARWVQHAKEAG